MNGWAVSAVFGVVAAAVAAWLGYTPAAPAVVTLAAQPRAEAEVPAPSPAPCVPLRAGGLAKPTSRTVDPNLDPELVGHAVAAPPALPVGWSAAEITALFDAPGDTVDCSEWPCVVERRRPGGDPGQIGDTVTFDEIERQLTDAGLDGRLRGGVQQVGDDEVLLVAVWPSSIELDPDVSQRTGVRLFWATEAVVE